MNALAGRMRDLFIIANFVAVMAVAWTRQPAMVRLRAAWRERQCAGQLLEIGHALTSYHLDHGCYPKSLGMLYPRYIKDPRVFVCPSALPRIQQGKEGYPVILGRRVTHSAYLLGYLSEEYPRSVRVRGGATPIVICDQHVQDVVDETWGLVENGPDYVRRHGDPDYLVLRTNGRLDRLRFSEARRRKWVTSNDF